MDVTNMNFPKNTFDFAVAIFVFCIVPNPIVGFKEVRRENILRSGLKIVEEKKLFLDIVNLFTCKKG